MHQALRGDTARTLNSRYVVTPDGSVYAIVVIDLNKAYNWINNNPEQPAQNGNPPDFPTTIADKLAEAKSWIMSNGVNSLTADEMAMALILEKYDTGVALLKQDANGNFIRLRTNEVLKSDGTPQSITANNCQ